MNITNWRVAEGWLSLDPSLSDIGRPCEQEIDLAMNRCRLHELPALRRVCKTLDQLTGQSSRQLCILNDMQWGQMFAPFADFGSINEINPLENIVNKRAEAAGVNLRINGARQAHGGS